MWWYSCIDALIVADPTPSPRIPFFAPPPEKEVKEVAKPLTLALPDAAENAVGLQSKASASAAAEEENAEEDDSASVQDSEASDQFQSLLGSKKVKGVDQPLRKIVVMNKFLSEDSRKGDDGEWEEESLGLGGEPAEEDDSDNEDEDEDEDEDEEDAEEEMTWEEMMAGGAALEKKEKGKGKGPIALSATDDEEEEDDDEASASASGASRSPLSLSASTSADDRAYLSLSERPVPSPKRRRPILDDDEVDPSPVRPSKAKRMTTLKKKAETYYTHANVKNKNQDKAARNELKAEGGGRARAGKRGGPTSGNRKAGGNKGQKPGRK